MFVLKCTMADYWVTAFVIPAMSIAFLLVLSVIALWKLVRTYRDNETLYKPARRAISYLITLVFMFYVHYPTFRHGIFLPTVTEEDTQYRRGYITAITSVPFSPRYSISDSSKTYRASLLTINGKELYFLCAEGLEIGQEIIVTFLPRCDVVLTCQVIDD